MLTTTAPSSYRIRPISPADRGPLTRFYAALSTDSVEARFHGALPTIPARTARFFCGPDHQHREGLVAETVGEEASPKIIGHVCIEPITPDLAEVAIAVADAWQHHGVGRAMLAEAMDWARKHDVGRLLASMRWNNSAMLELLRSTDQAMTFGDSDGGIIDVILDVGAATQHAASTPRRSERARLSGRTGRGSPRPAAGPPRPIRSGRRREGGPPRAGSARRVRRRPSAQTMCVVDVPRCPGRTPHSG